mmetsp:Transcript_131481/g.420673  ORF Transcript_131481/g.420673 Transcript_131481/m.420673 type:complete len:268 (+) Transcript_131481:224-1027(+)
MLAAIAVVLVTTEHSESRSRAPLATSDDEGMLRRQVPNQSRSMSYNSPMLASVARRPRGFRSRELSDSAATPPTRWRLIRHSWTDKRPRVMPGNTASSGKFYLLVDSGPAVADHQARAVGNRPSMPSPINIPRRPRSLRFSSLAMVDQLFKALSIANLHKQPFGWGACLGSASEITRTTPAQGRQGKASILPRPSRSFSVGVHASQRSGSADDSEARQPLLHKPIGLPAWPRHHRTIASRNFSVDSLIGSCGGPFAISANARLLTGC